MASDIAITKPDPGEASPAARSGGRFRGALRSRIARRIVFANLFALVILAIGVLLLSETRMLLVQAKVDSLAIQGEVAANVLAETATIGDPEPALLEQQARLVLRRLALPKDTRVRLFNLQGLEVADTDLMSERIETRPLPDLARPEAMGRLEALWRRALDPYDRTRVIPWRSDFTLEEEVALAAQGRSVAGQRDGGNGEPVVSVSLPVQRVEAVVGVLTLEAGDLEAVIAAERRALIPFLLAAVFASAVASILLSLQIAGPLWRLADAADSLRTSGATRLSIPKIRRRRDEIGDLALSLEQMTEALADRIDSNERFAADVAHELKNPLTSIRSAVETARAVSDPAARDKLLSVIAADVGRLDRLITDMQRASTLEAETARAAGRKIDLERFLAALVESYGLVRQGDDPIVAFQGGAQGGAIVLGQEDALGQVFRNLIDNAKSFSPKGAIVSVRVTSEGRKGARLARAEVSDQGPGIPEDNLREIFRRFYTDRANGGAFGQHSGLGLSIAQQIVEAHKGRIWAENIPGPDAGKPMGARFIVELPCAHL